MNTQDIFGKCEICNQYTFFILTDTEKNLYRTQWAGVDFYNEICLSCFTIEKEKI